jgi:CobQ-like glutamine amidotransferase family enzyme
MTVRFLHLFPNQLGLNGESGNLDCLVKRLQWAGIAAAVEVYDGSQKMPTDVDAVFIGSGSLAGAMEALQGLASQAKTLEGLAGSGAPFLALGMGWEILGESVTMLDGKVVQGLNIYPSKSVRTEARASTECFGYDAKQNLTTGYANHSAEIELTGAAKPWINLRAGFGNSSMQAAKTRPDEGLLAQNLFAARLNGPLLPLNPHLADEFLTTIATRSGFSYSQQSEEAARADGFAANARNELMKRLAR